MSASCLEHQPTARRAHWRELARSQGGNVLIEFALVLPVFLGFGLYGVEIARMAVFNMQVSQIAASVADNAARIGQTDNSGVTPTVSEADVNSVMAGAISQGSNMSLRTRGKVILTSLERDTATGKQYIHWQRCTGNLAKNSAYGNDTNKNGLTGPTLAGMGRTTTITAPAGTAVMFVEVYYTYAGVFGRTFVGTPQFRQEAAFLVRDNRNLGPGVTGTGGTSICA